MTSLARAAARGFTLIELMVALAIAVLLLVLAAPGYATWVADQQIRAGAERSTQGGTRLRLSIPRQDGASAP